MIGELSNHLWQSSLFVLAAGLLAGALRKNGAHVRHLVWVTASLKFLVPFSLLLTLGSQWTWTRPTDPAAETPAMETVSVVMDQIAQPFTDVLPVAVAAPRSTIEWAPIALFIVWACGFVGITLWRLRAWRHIRAAVTAGTALRLPIPDCRSAIVDSRFPIAVVSCPGLLEPGIVGLWRPILLLPAGIEEQLTPSQLEAVLAHELCHIHRRDNVTAAIHMIVEAVFWFHPLVWWIGARMVDERERACDEHVLRTLGTPEAYAEGILNVCKLYVESPLTCVSGVTGSNLKKRIEAIMVNHIGLRLNAARKIAITAAAVLALAAPIIIGMITSPIRAAAAQAAAGGAQFEVVSIKPCGAERLLPGVAPPPPAGARRGGAAGYTAQTTPGRVYWDCVTLATLIDQAYADVEHPLLHMVGDSRPPRTDGLGPNHPKRVRGGPSWVTSDMFAIEAKAPVELTTPALAGSTGRNLATLPAGLSLALRAVLEDRFKVQVHRVTEQQDMYALMVADGGLDKTRVTAPLPGDCVSKDKYFELLASRPPPPPGSTIAQIEAADPRICGGLYSTMTGMEFSSATLAQLSDDLSRTMDKYVLDATGIDTKFNFKLRAGPGDTDDQKLAAGVTQLGLRLKPITAPAEYLAIDRAERPTPDLPAAGASSGMLLPIVASVLPQAAQTPTARFEVASIKPCERNAPSQGRGGGGIPITSPGRLYLQCYPLSTMFREAYIFFADGRGHGLTAGLSVGVEGEPDWMKSERYTIEAKTGQTAPAAVMRGPMLQALLEERFTLKIRRVTREMPVYELVIAKSGAKVSPYTGHDCVIRDVAVWPPTALPEGQRYCGDQSTRDADRFIRAGVMTLDELAGLFAFDRPVVNKTGITAPVSYRLELAREDSPAVGEVPSASWLSALRNQLGLDLRASKGPRDFLVIDHVERPTPDLPASTRAIGAGGRH